jgi:hypothetical protein
MSAHLAGALVTCKRVLEMHKPSCGPRAAKPFFIPMVHSSLRAVGHVVPPELSPRGGGRAMRHVAALEPSHAGRQGPEPRGTWQHRRPSL